MTITFAGGTTIRPRKTWLLALLPLLALLLMADSCGGSTAPPPAGTTIQKQVCSNPAALTLAQTEICKRYRLFNDPNTFGYFYGFIPGTGISIEYIVQGSVFPVSDEIAPDQQQVCDYSGNAPSCIPLPSVQPDNTYGTNGTAIFGFLANGSYFEWGNSDYAYSTHPLAFKATEIVGCPPAPINGTIPEGC